MFRRKKGTTKLTDETYDQIYDRTHGQFADEKFQQGLLSYKDFHFKNFFLFPAL